MSPGAAELSPRVSVIMTGFDADAGLRLTREGAEKEIGD